MKVSEWLVIEMLENGMTRRVICNLCCTKICEITESSSQAEIDRELLVLKLHLGFHMARPICNPPGCQKHQ